MYVEWNHLGNTRAVVAKNTTTGLAETISYTDYYPHGGTLPGRNYVNSLGVPYAYQGIEKDAETNLLNFELRQYDARLGRWYNPDPMGQHHSPYLAMGNNPVSFIDPDGGYDNSSGDDGLSQFNSFTNHSYTNGDMDRSINEQQAMGLLKHDYNEYKAEHYNKKTGEWGSWKSIRPLMGDASTIFVVDPSLAADRPTVRSEYSGNGAVNIRGPVDNSFGTGGYNVSVGPDASFLRQEDGSVNDFFDNTGWYKWSPELNAYYDKYRDEIYGGVGVNIANAYMQTTTGANFGQSEHPSSEIGIGVGKFQNGMNTVAAVGNLANLSYGALRIGLSSIRRAAGPMKQWIRIGPSFSENLGVETRLSIRWGASTAKKGKYLKQIENMSLRQFNQYLRKKKLPGYSWRVTDSGHFHLKL